MNDLLTNIFKNDIRELHDLIYTGAKLVCEKIGVPLKTTDRKSKPRWELRLESQIKRLRPQTIMLKQNIKKYSDETEKARQLKIKIKLEKTNKKKKKTSKRRKTKKVPKQVQTMQTKQYVS